MEIFICYIKLAIIDANSINHRKIETIMIINVAWAHVFLLGWVVPENAQTKTNIIPITGIAVNIYVIIQSAKLIGLY